MGRARLKLKFIEKAGYRMRTFKKRKIGLIRKLDELTTLCGVDTCMILTEPAQNRTTIWPEHDPDHVRRLIDLARSDPGRNRTYGLLDFLEEKRRQVREETVGLRNFHHPDQDRWLTAMTESQLREIGSALRSKAQAVRSRIELLKNKEVEEETPINNSDPTMLEYSQDLNMPPPTMLIDSEIYYGPPPPPLLEYSQDLNMPPPTMLIDSEIYYGPPPPLPQQPCFVYSTVQGLIYFFPKDQNH